MDGSKVKMVTRFGSHCSVARSIRNLGLSRSSTVFGLLDDHRPHGSIRPRHACLPIRRHIAPPRKWVVLATLIGFAAFYWAFDRSGGFNLYPSYPSPSALWIFLPFIEGLAYATAIAWYDNTYSPPNTGFSRLLGKIGEYSYSIYLFHFFWVFAAARFINQQIMDISNFYVACTWSLIVFVVTTPFGYLSFRFIESPFLRLRRPYVVANLK